MISPKPIVSMPLRPSSDGMFQTPWIHSPQELNNLHMLLLNPWFHGLSRDPTSDWFKLELEVFHSVSNPDTESTVKYLHNKSNESFAYQQDAPRSVCECLPVTMECFSLWINEVGSTTQAHPEKDCEVHIIFRIWGSQNSQSNLTIFLNREASFLPESFRLSVPQKYMCSILSASLKEIYLPKYLLSPWCEAPNGVLIQLVLYIGLRDDCPQVWCQGSAMSALFKTLH